MRTHYAWLLGMLLWSSFGCGPRASLSEPAGGRREDSQGKGDGMDKENGKELRAQQKRDSKDTAAPEDRKWKQATFAGGCFWCTEAMFERLRGVGRAVSGYSGGHVTHPTYERVCSGDTGHAEAIQIDYDPEEISYTALLEVFWKTHDPTTLNRQGNDIGPQYRSAIFYHDEEQKKEAEAVKIQLDAERIWSRPIVTEIVPYREFWPAEEYHQDYYARNAAKAYCRAVITPKLDKFRKVFRDRLKTGN